jgi:hypothetical protein
VKTSPKILKMSHICEFLGEVSFLRHIDYRLIFISLFEGRLKMPNIRNSPIIRINLKIFSGASRVSGVSVCDMGAKT